MAVGLIMLSESREALDAAAADASSCDAASCEEAAALADAFCRNLFLEAVAFLRFFDAAGCCWETFPGDDLPSASCCEEEEAIELLPLLALLVAFTGEFDREAGPGAGGTEEPFCLEPEGAARRGFLAATTGSATSKSKAYGSSPSALPMPFEDVPARPFEEPFITQALAMYQRLV